MRNRKVSVTVNKPDKTLAFNSSFPKNCTRKDYVADFKETNCKVKGIAKTRDEGHEEMS